MNYQGMKAASAKLYGLQYLRAIAATMVVIFHAAGQIPAFTRDLEWPRLATGVDVFFVISGYIMALTGARLTPQAFVVRRLVRIVPLYWLLTTLLVILALLAPHLFRTTVLSPSAYVLSLLFIPFHNAGQEGAQVPLLVLGWTLNYEMFFYALFALALWLKPERLALITGVFLWAVVALGAVMHGFYTSPLILEFWLGIVIARTYTRPLLNVPLNVVLALAMLVGGFTGLLCTDAIAVHALCAGAIVLGALSWERSGKLAFLPLGVALGDASYSIYLSHVFMLGLTRSLWLAAFHDGGGTVAALGFALFSTLAVLAGALACYRWVEAPITATLHRLWVHPAARAADAPPAAAA